MDTSCLSYEQLRSRQCVFQNVTSSIRWRHPTQTIISTVHDAQGGLDTVRNLVVASLLDAFIRIWVRPRNRTYHQHVGPAEGKVFSVPEQDVHVHCLEW